MPAFRFRSLRAVLILAAILAAPQIASASSTVATWEFTGVDSPVSSVPATAVAPGVTGRPITRSTGLSDVAGTTNSFNSSGWNVAGRYVSLGFTVAPGTTATISEFDFASRSSATGPGSMNVEFSVNGGAFMTVATITQPSATYVDTPLTFAPIAVTSSLVVEFVVPAGATAANGGAIGANGSWRISDYSPDDGVTYDPVRFIGTVASVPEPSGFVLAGIALVGVAVVSRVRSKSAARA